MWDEATFHCAHYFVTACTYWGKFAYSHEAASVLVVVA